MIYLKCNKAGFVGNVPALLKRDLAGYRRKLTSCIEGFDAKIGATFGDSDPDLGLKTAWAIIELERVNDRGPKKLMEYGKGAGISPSRIPSTLGFAFFRASKGYPKGRSRILI